MLYFETYIISTSKRLAAEENPHEFALKELFMFSIYYKEGKMRTFKFMAMLCLCLLVFFAAPSNNGIAGNTVANPDQMGPYAVGFKFFLLTDPSRNTDIGGRPIAVYVWYPANPGDVTASTPKAVYPLDPYNVQGGFDSTSEEWESLGLDPAYQAIPVSMDKPFPIVVFSPGWGCAAYFYLYLAQRLASHGFVVAALTHYRDWTLPLEPLDHPALTAMNRPRDVSFALTKLLEMNEVSGDLFYKFVNPNKIAASGHSFGGYASLALAGGDDVVCDIFNDPFWSDYYGPPPPETCVETLPDPRIKMIVPIDGSNQCLYFYELARISIPVMGIGEEWSTLKYILVDTYGYPDYWASWQARQHAAMQGHPCYRVDVADTYHMTFGNFCEALVIWRDKGILSQEEYDDWVSWYCTAPSVAPIPPEEAYRLTNKYVIAFLKTNLSKETGYQNILTPGYAITREPRIEFFVTEKSNPNAIDEDWPGYYLYFMHQPGKAQAKAPKDPSPTLTIFHPRIRK